MINLWIEGGQRMMYRFATYTLDTSLYELRHHGQPRKLEPRAFNVLAYLMAHRDHVVTREELLDYLWPDQYISEAMLNNCIMAARKAIGDTGQEQQMIKTVYSRGYRFIAPVEEQSTERPPDDVPVFDEEPLPVGEVVQEHAAPFERETAWPDRDAQNVLPEGHMLGTVLCATLDHIATLTERLSVTELQQLRQTFFTLAQAAAQECAGYCKFFGADGVLMLFAHGDHVQRAVQAADSLQQHFQEQLPPCVTRHPVDMTVSRGMHTGPVAWHGMTKAHWLLSPISDATVSLAIWLHYLATPGRLLASKATLAFVDEVDAWVDYGPLCLSGHAETLTAYQRRRQP